MKLRRHLITASLGALLIAPGFVASGTAGPLDDATPQCGDSYGRISRTPSAGAPAAPDPTRVSPQHHKAKHAPVPRNTSSKPPVLTPPPPPPSIRVATYNMLHGMESTADRTLDMRLQMQAAQLAVEGVDAIAVQEVSRTTQHGSLVVRLAEAMRLRTGVPWQWCFFATNPHAPGEPETRAGGGGPLSDVLAAATNPRERKFEEGLAVLSRYRIESSDVIRLPLNVTSGTTSQAALWARLRTDIGLVDVISTQTSGSEAQNTAVSDFALRMSRGSRASVIGCDCAVVESADGIGALREAGWVDTWRYVNPRLPGATATQSIDATRATATRRLDYVFARGNVQINGAAVFLNQPSGGARTWSRMVWPSDHYGVVTTLAI